MSFSTAPPHWRQIAGKALDMLLPPLCLSCDSPVGGAQTLCVACWGQIHFIAPPLCASCGAPFDLPVGDGMLCGACLAEPPHFTASRAAMLYDEASKRLILAFKHSDRTHTAEGLAAWIYRSGNELLAQADYIVPVPLHRWRLFKRRYNQAALLAHALGRMSGKPVLSDGLHRVRATPIQGHLNRNQRRDNVHGAFTPNQRHNSKIRDKNIVLVDDVLTTGATVNECSRILLKAGARSVKVLTLARVKTYV